MRQTGKLVLTTRFESQAARDVALKSPMDEGMEAGYARLDALLQDRLVRPR
jgi:hypothetical protein